MIVPLLQVTWTLPRRLGSDGDVEEKEGRTLPHDVRGENVARLHILSHLVPNYPINFPRPLRTAFIFWFTISAQFRHAFALDLVQLRHFPAACSYS